MAEAPIDRVIFAELEETAGAQFVAELVDTFLAEAPAMIAELRSAYAAGDADRFRRNAHSLKSNANTFGAFELAKLAKALEIGGMEPVRAASGAPLDALDAEYARAARLLAELTRG
jgi:HPt (histidine-containing phosphotransfer) domain-containing protein